MADQKFYENKLTEALIDAFYAQDNAKKYIKLMPRVQAAKAAVCRRISDLIHISPTEAEKYINMNTGKFIPGIHLAYISDDQLKQAFEYLESMVIEYNKLPKFTSLIEANNIANHKMTVAKHIQSETIRVFGEKKGKDIVDRAISTAQKKTNAVIPNKLQ